MNDATVRPAEPRDYEGLCRLLDEVDAIHRAELPWLVTEPQGGTARSAEYFEPFYAGKECIAFVADSTGDGLVGAALGLLTRTDHFPVIRPARYGVLDVIGVRASHRRRGIGERLTHAVEAWALSGGAEWLQLGVYQFNDGAQRFYEKLGYGAVSLKLRKPL